jgi:hypothetical protein
MHKAKFATVPVVLKNISNIASAFFLLFVYCNSDAPALSNFQDPGVAKVTAAVASAEITGTEDNNQAQADVSKTAEQWDDEALAAATYKKGATAASTGSGGLADMKSMDPKRSDQGYIKEKMRVEETKAQLAAAREGMERQAAQLKVDKEKKDEKKQANQGSITSNPRFGAAAASMSAGGTGTKWLPPHLRAGGGGGASMTRAPMPGSIGGFQRKVDTADEQLFPDLATADAIIEKQDKDSRAPKKTPVGGGATWGNKIKKPVVRAPKVEPVTASPIAGKESEEPAKTETAAPVSAAPVAKAPKRVVKKKKDLSTFKPGSS